MVALARAPAAPTPEIAEMLSITEVAAGKRLPPLAIKLSIAGGSGMKERITDWARDHQTHLEVELARMAGARSPSKGTEAEIPLSPSIVDQSYGSGFAGRTAELGQLRTVIDAVKAGEPTNAVVVGEAGAGKSRLVAEALRYAREAEAAVATGQCVSLSGGGEPLLPFREILLQLAPLVPVFPLDAKPQSLLAALNLLLPHHFGDAGQPRAATDSKSVFYLLRDAFREVSSMRPLIIVVEDLHWADIESIELVHYLAVSIGHTSFGLIATVRSSDTSASVVPIGARALVRELESADNTTIVRVGEETADALTFVSAYLASNYEPNDFPESFKVGLADVAGDNALFLQELILDLLHRGLLFKDGLMWRVDGEIDWTAVPARVESALRARIDALGDRERRLAAFGAVQGRRFHSQVMAHALGEDVDPLTQEVLERLVRQERFVEEDAVVRLWANAELFQFRFVHHLYATLLADRMGPIERTQVHSAVLRSLDRLFPEREPDLEPRRLNHAIEAHDVDRALELGDYVVGTYLASGAAKSALETCERLMTVASNEGQRAWVQILEAETLEALGRYAEALDSTTRVLAAKSALPKPAQLRLLHVHSMLLRRCGQFVQAKEHALMLHEEARATGEDEWACFAARDLGRTEESLGRYDESLRWYRDALDCAGEDERLLAGVAEKVGYSSYRKGDFDTAEQNYEVALAKASARNDEPLLSSLLLNKGILRMAQARFGDANALITESLEVRGIIGLPVPYARALSNLALTEAFLGRTADAESHVREAARILKDLEDWHHLAITIDTQGTIALFDGDADRASEFYREALRIAEEQGDSVRCQLSICNLANAAFVRGDPDEMKEWISAVKLNDTDPHDPVFLEVLKSQEHLLRGNLKRAGAGFKRAAAQMRELGDERLATRCDVNAARCGVKVDVRAELSEDAGLRVEVVPIPRM